MSKVYPLNKLIHWFFSSKFKNCCRTRGEVIAIAFVIIIAFLLMLGVNLFFEQYYKKTNKFIDNHALFSLHLAMNKAICGKKSMISDTYYDILKDAMYKDFNDHSLSNISIMHFPEEVFKVSKEEYCKSVQHEYVRNESTLKWIDLSIINIFPTVTVEQLRHIFYYSSISIIIFMFGILIYIGFSPFLGLSSGMSASILYFLVFRSLPYSLYPFIIPFIISYLTMFALCLHKYWHKNYASYVLNIILFSFIGSLFFNLRTSYLPFIFVGFTIFLVGICIDNIQQKVKTTYLFIKILFGLCLFIICFCYFSSKLAISHSDKNQCTYHIIAHPLVLGLGIYESNLSKREGIKWDDSVGHILAKRHVSDNMLTYSEFNYEKILFSYYIDLWKKYPNELIQIYLKKWNSVFHSSHKFDNYQNWILKIIPLFVMVSMLYFFIKKKYVYIRYAIITWFFLQSVFLGHLYFSGLLYGILLIGLIVLAINKIRTWNISIVTFIISICIAAFLIMLEATIIFPIFSKLYYSIFLLIMVMILFWFFDHYCIQNIFKKINFGEKDC